VKLSFSHLAYHFIITYIEDQICHASEKERNEEIKVSFYADSFSACISYATANKLSMRYDKFCIIPYTNFDGKDS